jgi:DNA-binding transcriptional ArsR family regulator
MKVKKARIILKSLADDTRLRIINLLKIEELSVNEICQVLGKEQSGVSKHLARLSLTEIVGDRRTGNKVYYFLSKPSNKAHKEFLAAITKGLADVEIFKKDANKLQKRRKRP